MHIKERHQGLHRKSLHQNNIEPWKFNEITLKKSYSSQFEGVQGPTLKGDVKKYTWKLFLYYGQPLDQLSPEQHHICTVLANRGTLA